MISFSNILMAYFQCAVYHLFLLAYSAHIYYTYLISRFSINSYQSLPTTPVSVFFRNSCLVTRKHEAGVKKGSEPVKSVLSCQTILSFQKNYPVSGCRLVQGADLSEDTDRSQNRSLPSCKTAAKASNERQQRKAAAKDSSGQRST